MSIDLFKPFVDFAPPGIRQALLWLGVGIGLFGLASYRSGNADAAARELQKAGQAASIKLATITGRLRPDSRLEGELVTIKAPSVEDRRTMLQNFNKMLINLAELSPEPDPVGKNAQETMLAFNDFQAKYIEWCFAQDAYDPWREWVGFGYVICGLITLWGIGIWAWSQKPPKKQSKIITASR